MTNVIRLETQGGTNVIHLVLLPSHETGISMEAVIAVGSLLTAVVAIVIAWYQISHQRKHDRLSVLPRLDFGYEMDTHKPRKITYYNCGFGPAEVTGFWVTIGATTLECPTSNQLEDALEIAGITRTAMCEMYTCSLPDHVNAGEEKTLVELQKDKVAQYGDLLKSITWKIEYTSFYGEKNVLVVRF